MQYQIILLYAFLLLFLGRINAQNVVNGSFENPSSPCPAGISVLNNATNWTDPFSNIVGDTCSTSDLFNSCDPFGALATGVPANALGNQAAHTGNGYAGIIAYSNGLLGSGDDGWREYVQNQLDAPLTAGQTYCIEVWISLADNSSQAIANFGVAVTNNPISVDCSTASNSILSDNGFPADVEYSGGVITDMNGWTQLQFEYTATGGEQYITFGNFAPLGTSTTQALGGGGLQIPGAAGDAAYYYVDDVSITQGACSNTPPCDSTINPFGPFCSTEAPSNLTAATAGGTWAGTGITDANAGTFDPSVAGPGTHTITYTAPCGSSNSIDITVNDCSSTALTASFSTSPTTICEGDCISFNNNTTGVGSGATYTWTFAGANPSTSTDVSPTNICYPAVGTYTVTLSVSDGGNSDDTTVVNYITVTSCSGTTIDFTPSDDTICQTNCITFTNNSSGSSVANFGWNFPGGTPSTFVGATPPQVCYDTPGSYTVTLVGLDASNNILGQKDTTILVESCPLPTVNFTVNNSTICENGCVNFTDQSFGMVGTASYSWSFPGADTPTSTAQNPTNICYTNIGTYDVTLSVTDNNGTGTLTLTGVVTVEECDPPVPQFTIPNGVICTGQCIDFTNESTNADSYEWIFEGGFPGGSTDENPTNICFNNEGTFDIQLIAFNTLTSDTLHQTLVVSDPPTVTVSDDVTIFEGTNTLLTVETNGVSHIWSPASSLSCEDCASTVAEPDSTTLYIVTVTADNGCTVTDTVIVTVVSVNAIGVPSAFSPNGDLVNDILFVEGGGIEKIDFNIYNRYGEKVFESTDPDFGWDGKFKGKPENPGVFAYTLEYVLRNGETGVLKGNITLVR